jgi:hypothetical protein
VNTHPQIAEAELLEATNPPPELLPRHVEPECLGKDCLCDDALHCKALGWSFRLLNPPLLQLQKFAFPIFIRCFDLEQLHEEKIDLLTECRGSLLA